ncbi:hypothetical protein VNO78_28449 [Psophocarpus tetragonolobus]|uniref:Uncharacterized protein n=1 Tax=Psophocarpus tetragonolobus TaxID=3891 RepID=A0AAN9S2N7_PSOTE
MVSVLVALAGYDEGGGDMIKVMEMWCVVHLDGVHWCRSVMRNPDLERYYSGNLGGRSSSCGYNGSRGDRYDNENDHDEGGVDLNRGDSYKALLKWRRHWLIKWGWSLWQWWTR